MLFCALLFIVLAPASHTLAALTSGEGGGVQAVNQNDASAAAKATKTINSSFAAVPKAMETVSLKLRHGAAVTSVDRIIMDTKAGPFEKAGDGQCKFFSDLKPWHACAGGGHVYMYGYHGEDSRYQHFQDDIYSTKQSCAEACASRDDGRTVSISYRASDNDCRCLTGRAGQGSSPASGYECYGMLPQVCRDVEQGDCMVSATCVWEPPSCDTAGSDRRLSATLSSTGAAGNGNGHVVHVKANNEVARVDVAAALAQALGGGDGFEALVDVDYATTQHAQLLVLDKDQMEYDSGWFANPDGPFIIQNSFLHSHPEIKYRVSCPAIADGAMCQVEGADDVAAPWFGECVLPADRPVASAACLNAAYEVSLFALPESHYLLGAVGPGGDCPDVALFAGHDGKRRVRFSLAAAAGVPAHFVGMASLRAVLAAEAQAPDPAALPFDVTTNSCLHHARAIWRGAGLPEDAALADFIVENIVTRRDGGQAVARRLAKGDPAVAGSGLTREVVKKEVYSQMEL